MDERLITVMDQDSGNTPSSAEQSVENDTASLIEDNTPTFTPNRKQKRKYFAMMRKIRKGKLLRAIKSKEQENKKAKNRLHDKIAKASKRANRTK